MTNPFGLRTVGSPSVAPAITPTASTAATAGGRTAYGTVPEAIGVPQDIYSQVGGIMPNLGALTSGAGGVIGSELSGEVSPMTLNALKTAAAQFGISSGMPGSGLATNQLFGNIAGYSEARQRQGLQDYLATLTGIGQTVTPQNLAAEISSRNAEMAAAPDPALAAQEQLSRWMTMFNLQRSAAQTDWERQFGLTHAASQSDWERQFQMTRQATQQDWEKMYQLMNPTKTTATTAPASFARLPSIPGAAGGGAGTL